MGVSGVQGFEIWGALGGVWVFQGFRVLRFGVLWGFWAFRFSVEGFWGFEAEALRPNSSRRALYQTPLCRIYRYIVSQAEGDVADFRVARRFFAARHDKPISRARGGPSPEPCPPQNGNSSSLPP